MTHIDPAPRQTMPPEGENQEPARLRGKLSVAHLVFTVLAFNAPLAGATGFIPLIIAYGNGIGAPLALLAVGAVILLFAVGFTAMARHLPNAGAFYAYVTAGLGRVTGLGASGIALVFYLVNLIGGYIFIALSFSSLIRDTFGGPDIPWWLTACVVVLIAGILGYFQADVSARVLAVFLVLELVMIVLFDVGVLASGGREGISVLSFSPDALFQGSIGVALMYGVGIFGGFESTAVFREEARDPEKTVPRATYLAIGIITFSTAIVAWALVIAYGPSNVVAETIANPTYAFQAAMGTAVGQIFGDIVTVLLVTSLLAAIIATHNVTTRYLYNLGTDRVLPAVLGRVSGAQGTPAFASATLTLLCLGFIVVLALSGADAATVFFKVAGIGGYAFIILLLLTSIAIPVYFLRNVEARTTMWKTVIAPLLAVVGFAIFAYFATTNLDALTGSPELSRAAVIVVFSTLAAGMIAASVFRFARPETYARIGRQ